jgi:uncharacterized protein YqcC (DUF446 family)
MQAEEKDKQVFAKLDEIEAEMKKIGFWTDNPPEFQVTNFIEAPTFELWLQCVFLPNARAAAEKNTYPAKSQVGLMAQRQYDYHEHVEQAQTLLALLHEFDRIIESK